jgi:hypothetical protein
MNVMRLRPELSEGDLDRQWEEAVVHGCWQAAPGSKDPQDLSERKAEAETAALRQAREDRSMRPRGLPMATRSGGRPEARVGSLDGRGRRPPGRRSTAIPPPRRQRPTGPGETPRTGGCPTVGLRPRPGAALPTTPGAGSSPRPGASGGQSLTEDLLHLWSEALSNPCRVEAVRQAEETDLKPLCAHEPSGTRRSRPASDLRLPPALLRFGPTGL